MKYIFMAVFLLLLAGCFQNKVHYSYNKERYYQVELCKKLQGIMEYRLKDKTRVDCLTNKYAIEVDWAKKWAESIGQSLYYAQMTDKIPAVGLICGKKDKRFIKRLNTVAQKENIKVFILQKK